VDPHCYGAQSSANSELPLRTAQFCCGHLESGLRLIINLLKIDTAIMRSSEVDVDPSLRGQARVIATIRAVGATRYVNAPGGRTLYDPVAFRQSGIELAFLAPYEGRFRYLLPALMAEPGAEIGRDVREAVRFIPS